MRIDTGFDFIHPKPTHGPNADKPYFTAGQALEGVKDVPYNNEQIGIKEKTRKMLELIPEGGNFTDVPTLDSMLSVFGDDVYSVSTGLIVNIIKQIDCDPEDWNADAFAGIINALTIDVPLSQAKLIVRRERDIAKVQELCFLPMTVLWVSLCRTI